ncbi:hypothetical protein ACEWY4_013761 [Coilia grayii]|uniref:SH2 domain-containing protein n=1 Tax=Coilia grayii TaxID=363190 RepID=A0ABD1JX87_9TELE
MAKWLRDYLSLGSRRGPPQPPTPDYTESEILRAYRAQKALDFEDPYECSERRESPGSGDDGGFESFGALLPNGLRVKVVSPKHRLIKVDSQEFGRCVPILTPTHSTISFQDPPPSPPVVPSAPAVGDTDYSDPFDARPNPRAVSVQAVPVDSGSYMEPFEAQRVITELQQGQLLYDSPYEERSSGQRPGAESDEEAETSESKSRLPQDDERPADEYDQPWEWKKHNISKALAAVQFDGSEWEETAVGRGLRPSPSSGGGASLRQTSDLQRPLLGERVDPHLPLEQQVWYHGALTRSEAESLLTLCKECSYLVRNSQTSRTDYSLSIRSCHGFMHMKFSRDASQDGKYVLGENSPPFGSIPEVIHYYTTHKLPIRGAEHLSLLFPVLVQTL